MSRRSRNHFNANALAIVLKEIGRLTRNTKAAEVVWAEANPLDPKAVEILSRFDTERTEEDLERLRQAEEKRQRKAERRGWVKTG